VPSLAENLKLATLDEASALFNAMRSGDLAAFREIVTKNPKVLQWATDWPSILHQAAGLTTVPIVDYILSLGFDINDNKGTDHSPLYYAAERKTNPEEALAMVRFLIERGININHSAGTRQTALHVAAVNDNSEIIRCLLDHGADPRYEDAAARTPLATAIEFSSHSAEAVLRERGAPLKGIPSETNRAKGTVKIDLPSYSSKIRKLLQRAIKRYQQEHGDEKLACLALYASGVSGFVAVCLQPGEFTDDIAGMKYAFYEKLEIPWWEDAYHHADRVLITSHTGRIIKWNPARSGDKQFEEPFFRFLMHLLKELGESNGFKSLPRAEGFQVGLEIMEGWHAAFWKHSQTS
jgi:hypothetical protein